MNDYRKYGLLRTLTRATGLRVGVCWLLTADDGGADGELRRYLGHPSKWRRHDPELYDALRRLLTPGTPRTVSHARAWDLLPNAKYFDEVLRDDAVSRTEYFSAAWQHLSACPVLFLDPDNGIEVTRPSWGARGSAKYVYWRELNAAFLRGHSILVYQHFPRVPREAFVAFLAGRLAEELCAAAVLAFSTAHVAFFLVQHQDHVNAFDGFRDEALAQWRGQIEPWRGRIPYT